MPLPSLEAGMRRRHFIIRVGGAVAPPFVARAQPVLEAVSTLVNRGYGQPQTGQLFPPRLKELSQ